MKPPSLFGLSLVLAMVIAACTTQANIPTQAVPPTPTLAFVETTAAPLPTTTETATSTPTAPPSVTTFPNPESYQWVQVVGGLQNPVNLANAGDGSNRLFVLEKKGLIRVISGGTLQENPFLDISSQVGSRGSEQGLLGLAFHPDFKSNGYFYLDYTDTSGNTIIARFTADPQASAGDQKGDPASEKVLLTIDQPFSNHNGGHILFGPDGMLWIGMGDGGSGGDPHGNGQSLNTLLGKLLRIDVNRGDPYAIPADNPFASRSSGLPEIWAFGLRNPWQFSFDAQTADLYIADVGQDQWEEVDFLPSGFPDLPANLGWNIKEGSHPFNSVASPPPNLIDPVTEYDHSQGCSIIGGGVYRGQALPEFNGVYLFGDYCSGTIWGLLHLSSGWQSQLLFNTGVQIQAFGTDQQGEVYFVASEGSLYRLEKR